MRLRNVVLVSAVLIASGGLALEFAARSAAVRLARALEPSTRLTYDNAGIALDGSIRLTSPRLEFSSRPWKGALRARVANLRGPGRFWLVGQTLANDPEWPADLSLTTRGLTIEETDDPLISSWVGMPDLALFENLGCGSDALSSKDRARMGIRGEERVDVFGYHLEREAKRLELSMALYSEDVASWSGSAEFTGFDPSRWDQPAGHQELRLGRASLSYEDPAYLSRRNKFCAEWLGITPAQFVERHVAAVRTFLATRGIDPSEDVLGLYQRMVNRGGSLNLASLPDATWAPADTDAYPRQVLLRLLNITVRIDDAQPIMLRLAFTDPEEPLYVVTSELPDPALVDVLGTQESGQEDAAIAAEQSAPLPATQVAPPPPVEVPTQTPASVAGEVQVAAALADESADDSVAMPSEDVGSRPDAISGLGASAPPPPENSTLALVWKPGQIERLPPAKARAPEYDVVPVSSLGSRVGKRVQLLTSGGKRVDGDVQSVEAGNLVLLVQVGRGSAELNVPLENIREARLMRLRSSDSR